MPFPFLSFKEKRVMKARLWNIILAFYLHELALSKETQRDYQINFRKDYAY